MSEWDDTEEYTYPRKWSEEEMDERFADLYTQIMDEVKELFFYCIQFFWGDKGFITEVNLHKKQKLFFGVKNTSQLVNRFKDSKTGLPKGHKLIDNMLSFIKW